MLRLLLIWALCITPLLADEFCGDRILSHGVRDTTCDNLVLAKGKDLPENIQPVDNVSIFNVWMHKATGEIDETTFPVLGKHITKLSFYDSKLSHFKLPDMPKLEEVEISQSTFPKITGDTFKNSPNLEQLLFRSNKDFSVEESPLKHLHKLKKLIIDYQKFPRFSKSFLKGLKNLEYLSFFENDMETLNEDAFEDSNEITSLYIREPKLTKFAPKTFKPLKKLKELDVRGTNLEEFSIDLLSEQGELTNLGLPTKFLANIGLEKLKEKLPKLGEIEIADGDEDSDEVKEMTKVAETLKIILRIRRPVQ